jgi:spore maturation protein CgeB
MNAMEDLGCRISPFDISPYYLGSGRVRRWLTHRLAWGAALRRLNRDLCRLGRLARCDWIWIDRGTWIGPETVETLRRTTGGRAIHYTPDPAIVLHATRHFLQAIPHYDVLITSKPWEVDLYYGHGAKHVVMLPQGYDRAIFQPHEVSDHQRLRLASRVCFVGHYEDHYYRCVKAARAVLGSSDLAVWGRWQRYQLLHPWLTRVVRGSGIWGVEYAKALCCTEIALGLVSQWIPETSTTRTFEIPACGTFLLAERTEEHQSFYEEGQEAEFFGSPEELQDKTRYYLAHPEPRKRIAAAGRRRCLAGGYSYHDRTGQILELLRAPPHGACRALRPAASIVP